MEEMRYVADAFYQERIQDGLAHLESMITEVITRLGEDQSIVMFLDAVEAGDYVFAADIIEYEMIGKN